MIIYSPEMINAQGVKLINFANKFKNQFIENS